MFEAFTFKYHDSQADKQNNNHNLERASCELYQV